MDPTANVAVEVGMTETNGVFVAVTANGVTPGATVDVLAAGAPGDVVNWAVSVPAENVAILSIVVGCAEANRLLCGMGVFVTAGACE